MTEECKHNFELSKIELVLAGEGAGSTNLKKVAYVICTKCGKIKQQDL